MKIKFKFTNDAFDFIKKRLGNLIPKFVKFAFTKRLKNACIINSNRDV